jgi:hypothetical protein
MTLGCFIGHEIPQPGGRRSRGLIAGVGLELPSGDGGNSGPIFLPSRNGTFWHRKLNTIARHFLAPDAACFHPLPAASSQ